MSMIGQKAPEWSAQAYVNGEEKGISSKDFAGKWYVLYWYPLDFTFICPTEIRGFQGLLEEFAEDGVEIVGASTDSFFSHNAWFAARANATPAAMLNTIDAAIPQWTAAIRC